MFITVLLLPGRMLGLNAGFAWRRPGGVPAVPGARRLHEPPAAGQALVLPDPLVPLHVHRQLRLLGELLGTHRALVLPDALVYLHVEVASLS